MKGRTRKKNDYNVSVEYNYPKMHAYIYLWEVCALFSKILEKNHHSIQF